MNLGVTSGNFISFQNCFFNQSGGEFSFDLLRGLYLHNCSFHVTSNDRFFVSLSTEIFNMTEIEIHGFTVLSGSDDLFAISGATLVLIDNLLLSNLRIGVYMLFDIDSEEIFISNVQTEDFVNLDTFLHYSGTLTMSNCSFHSIGPLSDFSFIQSSGFIFSERSEYLSSFDSISFVNIQHLNFNLFSLNGNASFTSIVIDNSTASKFFTFLGDNALAGYQISFSGFNLTNSHSSHACFYISPHYSLDFMDSYFYNSSSGEERLFLANEGNIQLKFNSTLLDSLAIGNFFFFTYSMAQL